ncbi:MAG: hypothetical protein WKG00_10615 [Polyangiaceae bacterium]
MAGVYGEIDSRADFHRVLDEAIATAKKFLAQAPDDLTVEVIDTQLDAIRRWTAQGRAPTQDERKSLDMGLRAVRELEPTEDVERYSWIQKLYALESYVEDWPDDATAASATDDDWWDKEEDDD